MAFKTIIASILAAGTALAASSAHTAAKPTHATCDAQQPRSSVGLPAALRSAPLVSRAGRLALPDGTLVSADIPDSAGIVRHVAADPALGVAAVIDRQGGDDVVIASDHGTSVLHRAREVFHPAWTPAGDVLWGEGSRLGIWSHASGQVSLSSAPVRGGLVFDAVALSRDRVLAAVAEPVRGASGEDENLSDLWRYDRRGGEWRRMTRFRATTDRWSIIRTLESGPDGVGFIRIHGRASATAEPTFERWGVVDGRARLLETLPGEQYLAGYENGDRLWNIPSTQPGAWILARQTTTGALRQIGCGAVDVDPLDVPDPDRAVVATRVAPDPGYPIPSPSPQPPAHEVAVLVGDYAGESGATNAAQAILDAYGPDAQVKVVDSDAAPTALKPGSWGAIMWIGAEGDPVNAIQHFWNKLPQFSDRSWVVAP